MRRRHFTVALAFSLAARIAQADDGGPVCPASVPEAGSPCAGAYACEYGGDAHSQCTTIARCLGGTWSLMLPPAGCGINAADCPSGFGSLAAGSRCPLADTSALCRYAEGACGCLGCLDWAAQVVSRHWECEAWSSVNPGCPVPRPMVHSACANDGQVCSWNHCCNGLFLGTDETCVSGVWQSSISGSCECPGPPRCSFDDIDAGTDAGAGEDAGGDAAAAGDDDERVSISPGGGCTFPSSGVTSPAGAVLIAAVGAWLRRRRVRS